MRILITTVLIVLATSTAHGQGQTLQKSLMHDGIQRNYTIYVPSSYTAQNTAPLVVNMHGYTLNRGFQMAASGMNAVAEREGFLVAYPDAINANWFGPQDNIGFVDRLLDDVSSQYSVNAARVYATGFSQGGIMSYLLSVEMPDRFAAIASVGGVRAISPGDILLPPHIEATPSRPFPILQIHGTSDSVVPYNGGGGFLSQNFPPVERVVRDYVLSNGGDTTPTIVELPNTNTTDGSTVRLISYQGGNYLDNAGNPRNAEILLYRIQNGGHNWPGDFTAWPGFAGTVNRDIHASTEIWNFFSRHEVSPIVPEPPVATWNVDADGNWSVVDNWIGRVPNAPGKRAVLGSIIHEPRIVTLDVPVTLGRLDFENPNSYAIAGPDILTLDVTSGEAQINVASGSHTISAPFRLVDNTTIAVMPAVSNLSITGPTAFFGKTVNKAGAGTLTLNNVRAAGLSVNGGAVAMAPNGTNTGVSVVGALSIAGDTLPTAKLDLANNAAIINHTGATPVATIRQQIIAGRGGSGLGASWNGQGITSSAAAGANATDPESRSVGYAENSALPLGPYTSFHGQAVDDTSILIAFTRTGDVNLDGVVDDDDVTIVGATYAPGVPQPHWALGDFDYNGFVDDDDVTLLGVFYDPSATPLITTAPPSATAVAAVPEPASIALALMAAMVGTLLVLRRSRARR